jgi:hypothetical protein
VKLSELEAYRYAGLRPDGFDGELNLYVSPTTGGVATVACIGRGAESGRALEACEGIASSLELIEGDPYVLGPDDSYAKELGDTVNGLNEARSDQRRRLARAQTRKGQQNISKELAATYGSAARQVAGIDASPAAAEIHRDITRSLGQVRSAYLALGSAAGKGQRKRYSAAAKDVRNREAAAERALGKLESLGYKIG